MNWQSILEDFRNFLKLEKNLSENTANAYSSDLKKLIQFFKENNVDKYSVLKKKCYLQCLAFFACMQVVANTITNRCRATLGI